MVLYAKELRETVEVKCYLRIYFSGEYWKC